MTRGPRPTALGALAQLGLLIPALALSAVPFLTLMGLAVHRRGDPLWSTASAMVLVFWPPIAIAAMATPARRAPAFAATALLWSALLFLSLPVYFPGERRDAFTTAIGLIGPTRDLGDGPGDLAAWLPDDPDVSRPALAEAKPAIEAAPPPPSNEDGEALAIPYEGEGRRMSVPVVFGHGDVELELTMLFDTGATYTTLTTEMLAELGIRIDADSPTLVLHTANGEREARIVLVDEVWLGNLRVPNVAIAACDACASDDQAGLLGLNVSGGFNLRIDADRREVTFEPRQAFNRHLDVKPFTTLSASFSRFPGGRVEMEVTLDNLADRAVATAVARIRCGADGGDGDSRGGWDVPIGRVEARASATETQALPRHAPCDGYSVAMAEASW